MKVRRAGLGRYAGEHVELAVEILEVGDDLERTPAGLAHRPGDPDQLRTGRAERRRSIAAAGAMVERPRGREPERARRDPVADQASHLHDLLGRGCLPGRAPLTHDEEPHGAVGYEGADVDIAWSPVERSEILVEALPLPADALVQGRARDVLDPLHQLDQSLVVPHPDRSEADAAVAHDDRRHAVPRRGCELAVPGRLAVIVGVDVHEPGRDQRAVGVDLLCRAGADPTDLGDHAPVDRDVGRERLAPAPVDDRSSPDNQVVHATIVARADLTRPRISSSGDVGGGVCGPAGVHLRVAAAPADQLGVGADLDDAAPGPSVCQPFDSYAVDLLVRRPAEPGPYPAKEEL